MSGVHQAAGGGPEVWTAPLRMAIVCRGGGYGALAGMASGAGVGGVLAWTDPSLFFVVVLAGLTGGYVGLAVGVVGGAIFASAAPCLARRAYAARLAGAALVPGLLAVGIGAFVRGDAGSFVAESGEGLAIVSALGIVGGALVGRRVLYGKPPYPWEAEDDRSPSRGGDGADSPE
jgi:hypothetical protein